MTRLEELEAAIAALDPSTHEPDSPMARVRWANARISAMKLLASEVASADGKSIAFVGVVIGERRFDVSFHSPHDRSDADFGKWAGECAMDAIASALKALEEEDDAHPSA